METDKLIRLYTAIVNGQPKPKGLTSEESAFWEKTLLEVKQIVSNGGTPEIPTEWE